MVLGHRGASADAPENTLAAFKEAVAQSADGVELDAMVCGSGEVVVCHDPNLTRLAGLNIDIGETPYSRLREIDVGSRFGVAFRGEPIPLLSQVLAALPDGLVVNVELKCDRFADGGLPRKVAAEIVESNQRHTIVVSSFNPVELVKMRLASPSTPLGLLFEPEGAWWLRHGTLAPLVANCSVHPEHTQCTVATVGRWHQRGYSVFTWTVDDADEIRRLCQAGVDAIITNRPRATLERVRHLSSRGQSSPTASRHFDSTPDSR